MTVARRSTFGSRYLAHFFYRRAVENHDENHPAAQGAHGRWLACSEQPAPVHSLAHPQSVGYLRQLARDPAYASYAGHWNRSQRKHAARLIGVKFMTPMARASCA